MSNFDRSQYKGNSIFRDQPNHSYFDKPYEDLHDCFYQYLNEIDSHFLKPEQQVERLNFTNNTVIDPRTKKTVNQLCYDYTKEEKTKIFHAGKRSMMTEQQHELGVRVLNVLQQCMELGEEDAYNWHRMQNTRAQESQLFQKFVYEFTKGSGEKIYAPCRKLLELYQNWYKSKAIRLMKRYPQETYNTHLGLPQVRQCKDVLSDHQVKLINQEIVKMVGEQCLWLDSMKEELKKFNSTIGAYAEIYENSEDLKDALEDKLQLEVVKIIEQELGAKPYLYMPLESLLFLLTAGDYVDMPTEMFLNIKEIEHLETDYKKYIIMDLPLPARQCGWHAYKQIVEQAAKAMLSTKETLHRNEENSHSIAFLNNSTEFKVCTLQDFLKKSVFTAEKLCKFAKTLIKWEMTILENDLNLQIYSSLDCFTENEPVAIKLEFKPTFGCEILTKYEILKSWFTLKLTGASSIKCLRLDVTNYQTLLEQSLNTRILEEYLFSIYHINCNQLLNNLFEFLKMLYNMPSGRYMLRYNPKFKDKLMLCKPSQEITQNTINVHELLKSHATESKFMSQQDFLAIDENLCSIIHIQHKVLPAAFSPQATCKNGFEPQRKNKVIKSKKEVKSPIVNKSKMKRIRRRKRAHAATQGKKNELKELEDEMELDRKMLTF